MRALLLTLLILLTLASGAQAQSLVAPSSSAPQSGIRQQGVYETAPITLDGDFLFTIATPTAPQPGELPISQRQAAIENALAAAVAVAGGTGAKATIYDPYTLDVRIVQISGQPVIELFDAHHPQPLTLLTVTPSDAKFHGTTAASLAAWWKPILSDALRTALILRQPAVEKRNARDTGIAAAVLVAFTLLMGFGVMLPLRRRVGRIEQRLRTRGMQMQRDQAQEPEATTSAHEGRRHFVALALRVSDPRRQAKTLRAIVAALVWVLVLIWFAAVVWALFLFPQTTPFAHRVVQTIVAVVATWIATGLLNRLLDVAINRLGEAWRSRQYRSSEERARELLRIPTVTAALSGFKSFLLVFVALLVSLGEIGIPVWSVVTFGGLTAIGITLAAQNFVRDFVNGFLVLFEDQYVVGDYITINSQSGIVENLTLRIAQLRDMAGNLVTIPHSTVTSVVNHSRNWSRVDYRISVDPAADLPKAIELVRRAIHEVAELDQWRGVALEPVEWIGVDALSRDGVVIRAAMKTAPLRQFDLRRAINERVDLLFKEAGIGFGAPIADPMQSAG